MFKFFSMRHLIGRLDVNTFTSFIANKVDFKCDPLLLPSRISYSVIYVAYINKPTTHTHFVVYNILHDVGNFILSE